jgi:hypothetical protein
MMTTQQKESSAGRRFSKRMSKRDNSHVNNKTIPKGDGSARRHLPQYRDTPLRRRLRKKTLRQDETSKRQHSSNKTPLKKKKLLQDGTGLSNKALLEGNAPARRLFS